MKTDRILLAGLMRTRLFASTSAVGGGDDAKNDRDGGVAKKAADEARSDA